VGKPPLGEAPFLHPMGVGVGAGEGLTVRWNEREQMTRDYEQKMAAKKLYPQVIGSSELKPIRV
jgi:hypothetical protein